MSAIPVPTVNIAALYNNTTSGTDADPQVMDNAIIDIIATINSNASEQNNNTGAAILPHADGSVITNKLADSAVTTVKIAPLAVTTAKIAAGAVGAAQLDPILLTDFGDIAVQAEFDRRGLNVMKYIDLVVGTDWSAAFVACFAAANALMYTGVVSTIKHSGAKVFIPDGVYNLTTLSAPIDVNCDVESGSAEVVITNAYAGIVFRVGLTTAGSALTGATVELPQIRKSSSATIIAGSIAVQTINLSTSKVVTKGIQYFETAIYCTGLGQGTTYCDIHIGKILQCKRSLALLPGSAGWVNSNQFYGGSISQSTGFAAHRSSGWRHVLMDGRSPATAVVGNNFIGMSLEGDSSEYVVEAFNAYGNNFIGSYHETGYSSQAVTVSGDTLTKVAHGLVVGDLVSFNASVTATGMVLAAAYYVVTIPTADTFKVSLNKGGTAITFTSTGTSVTYILSARCSFDGTGGLVYANRFDYTFTPPSTLIDFIQTGGAAGNGRSDFKQRSLDASVPEGAPLWRGRNTSTTSTRRPIFAAYPSTADPITQPNLWTVGMESAGIVYRSVAGAELGFLFNSSGSLSYTNASGTGEIAAVTRNQSSAYAISALSLTANDMTSTDITLTGVATNEHVLVTILGALPTGVIYSHAYVVSTNTIRIYFYNNTASPVSLTVNVQAMAFKRFV